MWSNDHVPIKATDSAVLRAVTRICERWQGTVLMVKHSGCLCTTPTVLSSKHLTLLWMDEEAGGVSPCNLYSLGLRLVDEHSLH